MTDRQTNNKLSSDPPPRCSPLALEKAKIVAPLRGMHPIPLERMAEACRAAGKLLNKAEGEVSHQTIRNWIEILEIEGPEGLDRKIRKNLGKTTLSPELERLIKGILLNPKRFSIAETHRRVDRYARNFMHLPIDEVPTRKQIAYVWEHIPEEEKVLAFEGIQGYRRKFDQHVRFEAGASNAIWQADHHQLDIIAIDAVTGKERGRPWLTKIQDDRSRAIVGYHFSFDYPSSMSIAFAMYHAFLPKPQAWWIMYGVPQIIYVDNGKDWISHHIEAVCLNFGIQLLPHEAYHPQSKGKIERWFETFEEMCVHPLDGSVGSNIAKRPKRITPKLTLEQIRVKLERFIKEYHETKHGTTKQRPLDRWAEDRTVIREVKDLADIDHLLKSKTYKVQRDGIHFQGGRYRDSNQTLGGYIGRRVTAFFNPRDLSRIRVWTHDDTGKFRFLCTAYPQATIELPMDKDAIAEENKRRRNRVRERVRESQKEGNTALNQLEAEEAQHDAEAQETVPSSDADLGTTLSTPEPAAGLLSSNRPQPPASPSSDEHVSKDRPDMDALRRQLIRSRRQQQ